MSDELTPSPFGSKEEVRKRMGTLSPSGFKKEEPRKGFLRRWWKVILTGIIIAIVIPMASSYFIPKAESNQIYNSAKESIETYNGAVESIKIYVDNGVMDMNEFDEWVNKSNYDTEKKDVLINSFDEYKDISVNELLIDENMSNSVFVVSIAPTMLLCNEVNNINLENEYKIPIEWNGFLRSCSEVSKSSTNYIHYANQWNAIKDPWYNKIIGKKERNLLPVPVVEQ